MFLNTYMYIYYTQTQNKHSCSSHKYLPWVGIELEVGNSGGTDPKVWYSECGYVNLIYSSQSSPAPRYRMIPGMRRSRAGAADGGARVRKLRIRSLAHSMLGLVRLVARYNTDANQQAVVI